MPIETTQTFNGKEFQTIIVTHKGYRRTVKFRHSDQVKVMDKVKLYKNHVDCPCGEK